MTGQVKGPERDIHSGNDGGVFNEPLSDLTKLLASLVDSRNNIMVPGFYEGVRPNTLGAALQRLDNCKEFSLAGYREALGIPKLAPAANMRSEHHPASHLIVTMSASQLLQHTSTNDDCGLFQRSMQQTANILWYEKILLTNCCWGFNADHNICLCNISSDLAATHHCSHTFASCSVW